MAFHLNHLFWRYKMSEQTKPTRRPVCGFMIKFLLISSNMIVLCGPHCGYFPQITPNGFTCNSEHNHMKVITKEWNSWKNFLPVVDFEPGLSGLKANALTTEPESIPWRSCQRLNVYLQAMRNLPRQIIEGRTLLLFKEVIIYDDSKPFLAKQSPIPDDPPSYDMKVVTKEWSIQWNLH